MLSANLIEEVDKKSGKIVSLREAWIRAIRQAIDSGLDENSVVHVLRAFEAPSSVIKLTESIGKGGLKDRDTLLIQVEGYAAESDFSTNEWFQTLERMLQFLIKQNRSSALDILLGYLSCSAEYLRASTRLLSFADSVDAFLEEFGFDG